MSFTALAQQISNYCKVLDDYIAAEHLHAPSLDRDGPLVPIPESAPQDVKSARTALLDSTNTLHDLVLGPAAMLVWPALTYPYYIATLRMLQRFSIPDAVPINQAVSFENIAATASLDKEFVSRLIKHASTYRVFVVDEASGMVSHTAPSRALVESAAVRESLATCLDERFLSTAGSTDHAMLRYGSLEEPRETAFNIAFDTEEDYLGFIRNPAHGKELKAMRGLLGFVMSGTKMGVREHNTNLLAGPAIDWAALGDGLVVDMGGGHGHVCVSIAKQHPKLRFMVQDLPEVIAGGRRSLQETAEGDLSISSRITFMEHDFLATQTVKDADIFMFRFVVHDWSDKYVTRILENLVPAMKPSTRIVIMDYLLAVSGSVPNVVGRLERTMDMVALAVIAGKERTVVDWQRLVGQMNGELEIRDIHGDSDSAFGLVVLQRTQ